MASRKKIDGSSRSMSKNIRLPADTMFSSSSSSDEADQQNAKRDRDVMKKYYLNRNRVVKTDQQTDQDVSRREENPFSFKHFLKTEPETNYYKTGARPKIYSSCTTSSNNVEKDTGVYSRNPTELPDFVQDHLVIEQCYVNHACEQLSIPDVDNLPDFALNIVEQTRSEGQSNGNDSKRNDSKRSQTQHLSVIPFDLTALLEQGLLQNNQTAASAAHSNNSNLSTFDAVDDIATNSKKCSDSVGFPFDLPLPLAEPEASNNIVTRDCTPTTDSNIPKLLPDFLNDGPIHSRTNLSNDIASNIQLDTTKPEHRLILENKMLRQELSMAQGQIGEKSSRIHSLETELASRRELDHKGTVEKLEQAVKQVEDNLKRSTIRALSAESTVTSLKKEIKTLTTEISLLRSENKELRSAIVAANKNECDVSTRDVNKTVRRLAGELRTAASTAELSLRQLMSGVDNLRVLASTLENVDRIEDRTKDFLPDYDENNAAGPAL